MGFKRRPSRSTRLVRDIAEEHVRSFATANNLTPKQTKILSLLISGVPRANITTAMGIATTTFKSHVTQILWRTKAERLPDVISELLTRIMAERQR